MNGPVDVAYSENIARRHLQVGQLAMFGAARKAWEAEQAKLRQSHGQTAPGKNASGNVSGSDKGDARDKAGAAVGVSGKSVDKAAAMQSSRWQWWRRSMDEMAVCQYLNTKGRRFRFSAICGYLPLWLLKILVFSEKIGTGCN